MSFHDLPDTWPDLPVDRNPAHCADVLDLFVSFRDRERGCLFVLLCDDAHRPVQPIAVTDIELYPPADAVLMLSNLVPALLDIAADATLLLAVGRPGPLWVRDGDRAWRECAELAFATLPVLGVYLITQAGSLPIPAGELLPEDRRPA